VDSFRVAVYYYHDRVVSLAFGEVCDEVDGDDLEWSVQDEVWVEFSLGFLWEDLSFLAFPATIYVFVDVLCQAFPPIVPEY